VGKIDTAAAGKALQFVRQLKHTKGRWAGQRFQVLPWQAELLRALFGTLKPNGFRQYKTCYCEIPKKNGKSELAAAVALKLLFADNEPGAEIFSAAADRDQAAIVFNVAKQMVKDAPALAAKAKIVDSKKTIHVKSTGSFYKCLSAEAYTKHGLNVHGVIFDELHAQPTRELWDVLTVGSGDARQQPLYFAITTAGYDRQSICWEIHEHARQVAEGIIDDPTFLPVLFAADDDADWEDPAVWAACNPSLILEEGGPGIITMEKVQEAYQQALARPAEENSFRRLRLNQWVRQETRWLRMGDWDASAGKVDPKALEGRECYAGLDLASTTDVAALVLVFPPVEEGGPHEVLPFFWIPEEAVRERTARDKVPYEQWVDQGHVIATEGNVIDYRHILKRILELHKVYNIKEVAFDRWGAIQLVQDLEGEGLTVVPFGQGYASMSGPSKEMEKLVLGKHLAHGGNPVLRWMADNVMVKQDPSGNIKPDKGKSTEKIDGIVATIMALDRCIRHEAEEPSIYETTRTL